MGDGAEYRARSVISSRGRRSSAACWLLLAGVLSRLRAWGRGVARSEVGGVMDLDAFAFRGGGASLRARLLVGCGSCGDWLSGSGGGHAPGRGSPGCDDGAVLDRPCGGGGEGALPP